jgi:hypothetical protein
MPMVTSIGRYALGSSIEGLEGLSELSRDEYLALPKQFADEKIYQVPDIEFLGFRWNLFIGVRDVRIYKISPQLITPDSDEAMRAVRDSYRHFFNAMGHTSERSARHFLWRVPGGNVILEQEHRGSIHVVQFFITGGPFDFVTVNLPRNSGEQEEAPKVAAEACQAKTVSVKPRQISPWVFDVIAQAIVFSIPILIGYWIWRPLGVAAIILALGSWASSLIRVAITSYPAKACLLGKPSIAAVAAIWGCSVGAMVISLTLLLSIPNWAAVLLFLWGWMAVGYPGWVEARGFGQCDGACTLLEKVRFFRIASMSAYVGSGIPPVIKHFF